MEEPEGLCRRRPRGGDPSPGRLLGDLDRRHGSFHSSGRLITVTTSFFEGGSIGLLGGTLRGDRGFSLSSSFFSLASRGGRILGLSFSSRFMRSRSHSSFRLILSFSRSRSLSLSLSLCRRSLSR